MLSAFVNPFNAFHFCEGSQRDPHIGAQPGVTAGIIMILQTNSTCMEAYKSPSTKTSDSDVHITCILH